MPDIHRILCPIDFSDASRHALDHAVVIAGWYQARITALHVEQVPSLVMPPILAVADAPAASERRRLAEELMRSWLAPAVARGIQADVECVEGTPEHQIVKRAASLPADLVVIGTHGRTGFDRLLLGSTAEKVLRKAPCPVLTVPPPASATSTLPFKRLLCPVDFSEPSIAALTFAIALAEESDARVTILHVFEWPERNELFVERTFDSPAFRAEIEARVRRQLDALVTEEARTWCEPVVTLAYGKPYRRILDAAADRMDLVVMGVRTRSAVDLLLFGSTANHVVRSASCPVLTIRR